jgi:hypothetical protein
MKSLLNNIRKPDKSDSVARQIIQSFFVFITGLLLGALSKHLDYIPSNELPYLIEVLDLRNFFGRLAIWILLAVILSVYSKTPVRAGINTFLFFTGLLVSYYAYTIFIAGFFPKHYMLIWIGLTLLSPILAFICWYARGEGKASLMISAIIIGVLFLQAFSFGIFYFGVSYYLEAIVWLVAVILLYKNPGQLAAMLSISLAVAIFLKLILPFGL